MFCWSVFVLRGYKTGISAIISSRNWFTFDLSSVDLLEDGNSRVPARSYEFKIDEIPKESKV